MRNLMHNKCLIAVLVVVFLVVVGKVSGLPWSTDMFRQPAIQPYQMPRGYKQPLAFPPNSVSIDEPTELLTRKDYEAITQNPVSITTHAIESGQDLFNTFCFPCHGKQGRGDGPVIKKGFYPVDLTSPGVKARTDGYIYSYIRYGGLVMMPTYREFISLDEAWEIVAYVRKLQGSMDNTGNKGQ